MKEALVILAVIGTLFLLTALRYRRQIGAGIEIWRKMKAMREQINKQSGHAGESKPIDSGKLVNCAKCGTWVPEDRAIRLRGGGYFCSSACVESMAQAS